MVLNKVLGVAAVVTLVVTLSACTGTTAEPPAPGASASPSVTVTAQPAPVQEPTEPEETPEPVLPTPGTVVAAQDAESLREQGLSVYVSPSGTAVVVDPAAPLPEVVAADVAAAFPAAPATTMADYRATAAAMAATSRALTAAGLSAVVVYAQASYGADGQATSTGYIADTINVIGSAEWFAQHGSTLSSTPAGALAKLQPLIDQHPGITVIDATS